MPDLDLPISFLPVYFHLNIIPQMVLLIPVDTINTTNTSGS